MDDLYEYDLGWEAAWDHGHQVAENWWLDQAASGIHSPYNSLRPHLANEYCGNNMPEHRYYS